jgi:hypothetical protein
VIPRLDPSADAPNVRQVLVQESDLGHVASVLGAMDVPSGFGRPTRPKVPIPASNGEITPESPEWRPAPEGALGCRPV